MSEGSSWKERIHADHIPCAGCFALISPSELVWCVAGGKEFCTQCAADRGAAKARDQRKVDDKKTVLRALDALVRLFTKT